MSPRAANKTLKLDPSVTYVAWQSFAVDLPDGTSPVVKQGSRLRGDNPCVVAAPHNFVPDGASREEVTEAAQAFAATNPLPAPESSFPPPPPLLRDEDAAVAIRDVNSLAGDRSGTGRLEQAPLTVKAGERLPKDHPIVEHNAAAFRPVVPGALRRENALVATTTMMLITEKPIDEIGVYGLGKNEHIVYSGTWVARDCSFVKLHPTHFRAPAPEPA
jgi:hypothetical protein